MGVTKFLQAKPHLIYFGKNDRNAHVILISPFEQLHRVSFWKIVREYAQKYIKIN